MKQDLERVKTDVETIQNAMQLAPSFRREWIQWMKRDQWFNLWWCVPGLILIASALLPLDPAVTYLGLAPRQWAGILVAATLLGIAIGHSRHVSGKDGRPEQMVRQSSRIHGLTTAGLTFGLAVAVQMLLYFAWARQYHISGEPFWAGLFILLGSTCLAAALAARAWVLLGYAIPFIGYGLCLPLAAEQPNVKGLLFGLMFVGIALSFSLIQVWEIRKVERARTA
jgi:hypothetical protein